MYHMKKIVSSEDVLVLPKCMYPMKNKITASEIDEMDINISDQVIKFLKETPNLYMSELEKRQDKLLLKLDYLYERIKTISSKCNENIMQKEKKNHKGQSQQDKLKNNTQQEIILNLSPDNLPWFINIFLKDLCDINVSWHIHSTIHSDKVSKIEAFLKKNEYLHKNKQNEIIDLRIIFKNVSASAPELKLASLDIPIVGTVNILRFLCCNYPNVVSYNFNDHNIDNLLDLCFLLERAPDKNRESVLNKIFSGCTTWIYNNDFSIVDIAVFNIIKQMHNHVKYVPSQWLKNCEKMITL